MRQGTRPFCTGGGTMIMTRSNNVLIVAVAAVLGSCRPYQVHTDYDEKVSFAEKRTFAWLDSTRLDPSRQDSTRQDSTRRQGSARQREDQTSNPFLERRVKRAVELVMVEHGLSESESDRADLLVTAFVIGPSRQDRLASQWLGAGCGPSLSVWFGRSYPYGFSRRGSPWFFPGSYWRDPYGYACSYRIGYGYGWLPLYGRPGGQLAGTLVVDILDGATHEVLWRGSAEGALIDIRRSDQSQGEIDRIVREVLKEYPPKS